MAGTLYLTHTNASLRVNDAAVATNSYPINMKIIKRKVNHKVRRQVNLNDETWSF